MFEPSSSPRYFGVAPGADFASSVVEGLRDHLAGHPPEAMAQVDLYVNTRRMARRIRDLFDENQPGFLPKIKLITDLGKDPTAIHIPQAVPPLRRRLELIQLISGLLESQPDLAPRSSLFDLADSLMKLTEEMQGEGVPPSVIRNLDITDQSGHWERALKFIGIVQGFFGDTDHAPDNEARQRRVIEELGRNWVEHPPIHPIIIAGSTGSRGTTARFMEMVANAPQGAVILPGFDFAMPRDCWDDLSDAMTAEDHPQFRFRKLLGAGVSGVQPWASIPPANPERNALVSLALRPAPVTDQWLRDGPKLGDVAQACSGLTLLEAPSPRTEALAIALRLRQAAEEDQTAALISPDRVLTRQVTAALQRWGIVPDDSAGSPLQLTPSGRFLRHIAALFGQKLTSEALLTLLKHPLTHADERGLHQLWTQKVEVSLRKKGPPFPTRAALLAWAETQENQVAEASAWVNWLFDAIEPLAQMAEGSLEGLLDTLVHAAEVLSTGTDSPAPAAVWQKEAGREAWKVVASIQAEARLCGDLSAHDFQSLFGEILSQGEVRNSDTVHPKILIWGTMEARVQGAEVVILAGLNEGTWPERPDPDPWMSRAMRQKAGLLLPERRIGLAAHDFQQAIAGKDVWLTRSAKSDDAETVPSRWINRLTNLLGGLETQGGPDALDAMRARGNAWLSMAAEMERPEKSDKATRPSPKPPVEARPKRLSVTAIRTLIRDPYAIYALDILGLSPLDPLVQKPDAPRRGTLIHAILEAFVEGRVNETPEQAKARLLAETDSILAEKAPWPTARAIWRSKVERVADWFIERDTLRAQSMTPVDFESDGVLQIPELDFKLTAKADRIDRDDQGRLHIFDYKTGSPPTKKMQAAFDKQLLLEVAMAEMGGFAKVGAGAVAEAKYIGLNANPSEVAAPIDEISASETLDGLKELLERYFDPNTGYSSRRAMQKEGESGRYDQLARFGEWDISDSVDPVELTK